MATVEEIKTLLDRADAAEVEHADPFRWQAAEAIVAEIAAGRKAIHLAKGLQRSSSYISRYKWIWTWYGPLPAEARPTFRECELESTSSDKPGKRSYTRKKIDSGTIFTDKNETPTKSEPDDVALVGILEAITLDIAPEVLADKVPPEGWKAYREEADFAISVVSDYVCDYVEQLERRFAPMESDDEIQDVDHLEQRFAISESES